MNSNRGLGRGENCLPVQTAAEMADSTTKSSTELIESPILEISDWTRGDGVMGVMMLQCQVCGREVDVGRPEK
jgi:hypothetical protein